MVQTSSFDRQEQYTNSVHLDIIVAHYLDLLLVKIRNSNIPKNPKASIYLSKILSNKFVRLIGPAMSISYVEQLSGLESLFPLPVAYELGVIDKESTHGTTQLTFLSFSLPREHQDLVAYIPGTLFSLCIKHMN